MVFAPSPPTGEGWGEGGLTQLWVSSNYRRCLSSSPATGLGSRLLLHLIHFCPFKSVEKWWPTSHSTAAGLPFSATSCHSLPLPSVPTLGRAFILSCDCFILHPSFPAIAVGTDAWTFSERVPGRHCPRRAAWAARESCGFFLRASSFLEMALLYPYYGL